MTEQALKRAQDIEQETRMLKGLLAELLNARIFRISEPTAFGASADPFLADLEVKTRSFAADAINKRIKELSVEFKRL